MKTSLFLSSVLAWVGAAVCQAAESSPPAPSGVTASYVSIETPAGGRPMLVIRYPWRVHAQFGRGLHLCRGRGGRFAANPPLVLSQRFHEG